MLFLQVCLSCQEEKKEKNCSQGFSKNKSLLLSLQTKDKIKILLLKIEIKKQKS